MVKGRGQVQRSRSNVWRVAVDIRSSACRVQQRAITVKFGANGGHYRSEGFVCLSVISRACAYNREDAVDRLLIYWTNDIYCDMSGSPCLSKTGQVYGPSFFNFW